MASKLRSKFRWWQATRPILLTISCTGRRLQRRLVSSIYSFKRSLDLGDDSVTVGWDATRHCDALSVVEVSVHSSFNSQHQLMRYYPRQFQCCCAQYVEDLSEIPPSHRLQVGNILVGGQH
jgi:hypothetical protein